MAGSDIPHSHGAIKTIDDFSKCVYFIFWHKLLAFFKTYQSYLKIASREILIGSILAITRVSRCFCSTE